MLVVVGTIASQYVPDDAVGRLQARSPGSGPSCRSACSSLTLLGITTFGPAGVAPFIYYRF